MSLYDFENYRGLSREEKIAFWVNGYLTWLLRLFLDLPAEQETLSEEDAFFSGYKVVLLGNSYSLEEMQEEIWKLFKDERLFFVLPDGTMKAAPFPEAPLEAAQIESRLNESTLMFVRNPDNVRFQDKRLWLNPLFRKWAKRFLLNYGGSKAKKKKDLTEAEMAVINFLYQNAENEEMRSGLEAMDYRVYYLPPDNGLRKSS